MQLTRKQFLGAATALALIARSSRRILAAPDERTLPATIRVAIIGLAGHYSDVTAAAKLLPNLRFTAISDPSSETLARAARSATLATARPYTDHRALLASEPLDLIAICGENAPRARIVRDCAERNLPIMTEKPLALTTSELTDIKRTLRRHPVPLSMLLTMRCTPPYLAMRDIVRQGTIGEVVSMDAQKSYQLGTRPEWMKHRQTFGGTIPYIGIHMLDLMGWISGREFTQVAAFHSNVGAPEIGEMENNAALILKLDNHGSASLRMDYLRPASAASHGDDRLRIVGTRGIVEYQQDRLTLITQTEPLTTITTLPPAKSLFADFVESIYLGKSHIITPAEIFRLSEIVLQARAAADTGRVLPL
jgi:predicted dehydrogenase